MKTVTILFGILIIFIFSSCKKKTDSVIYVQVTKASNSCVDVSGIKVSILKERYRMDGKIMSSSIKLIDSYNGITDENGLARIPVNTKGIYDFWFWIELVPKQIPNSGFKSFLAYPERIDKGDTNLEVEIMVH